MVYDKIYCSLAYKYDFFLTGGTIIFTTQNICETEECRQTRGTTGVSERDMRESCQDL